MIKRIALYFMLAGLLAGCQSTPPLSAPEMREKVEPQEQVEIAGDVGKTEEVPAAEEAVKEAVQTEEPVEEAPAVAVIEPVEAVAAPVVVVEPKQKERNTVMILMKTSKGDMKIELDKEKAPKTVENFMKYVNSGHYTGVIFHRVINGFMIQGGGFDTNMKQKPAPHTVENEAKNGLKNDIGTIAMARTSDPHSGGAQFFINVNNNSFLNYPGQDGWGYCVFGKVVEGMEVANAIKEVPTSRGDVPTEQILITEVVVIDE